MCMAGEMERLDAATKRYARIDDLRREAIDAVIAALRAGNKPAEVARRSPFTDAYVRKLARENDIPPDERYVR